jgi:hypothetical protein
MRVETIQLIRGPYVEISHLDVDDERYLALTIPEAVELYTKLTHILESEHNAGRLEQCLAQRRQWEREASGALDIGGES